MTNVIKFPIEHTRPVCRVAMIGGFKFADCTYIGDNPYMYDVMKESEIHD